MIKEKSLPAMIEEFLEFFPKITKEESDCIEEVLKWDDGKRVAFMMAKRIFEEKDE
jgi:hypothetical protein